MKKSTRINQTNLEIKRMKYSYHTPHDIISILADMPQIFCRDNKTQILNSAISFDIETTSTYTNDGDKFACMYAWALDINDKTIMGRTWDDFIIICNIIVKHFRLNTDRRIIIWIHNLAYEFQFFNKYFNWHRVFATDPRKPIYAITDSGIEFRCSLRLSGYALSKIGDQIGIPKLLGDLDYTKIRHSNTPLTNDEIQYIIHDVKIVSAYIRQKIADENGIINIPLTKTGYVRRLFRARCLHSRYAPDYMDIIKRLKLDLDEYRLARCAFAGGFTHANHFYSGKLMHNVTSFDIASSYPTVLVAEKYPMGRGKNYKFRNRKHFYMEMNSEENLYILQIELYNVKSKIPYENYISYSKCIEIDGAVKNNGRVYKADRILLAITNIDFQIIKKCYDFDKIKIGTCYRYSADYLPEPFIKTLFDLYKNKTELKGVHGYEKEYMRSKEDINSAYGMCVMNIVRDVIEFNDNWTVNGEPTQNYKHLTDAEIEKQLQDDNNKRGRFLSYLWGVFCTAYARRRLWDAIIACGNDYVYSDTDSVKILNETRHRMFFAAENDKIKQKISYVLSLYNIPINAASPITKKGVPKPLGVWEFDGHYSDFKTLGAKRYLLKYSDDTRNDNDDKLQYKLTVAGLSKKDALNYILQQNQPFDFFAVNMYIPPHATGKMTHTYIDDTMCMDVTDYLGNTMRVISKSAIHLSKQDYKCSIAWDYKQFLQGKRDYFIKE